MIIDKGKTLNIAHRGFRGIVPENTMAAARAGYDAGADAWELDVAASADGTLVVIHDDTLVRTTDARERFPGRSPWSVYDFNYEELGELDAGSWYGRTDPFGQVAAGRVDAAALSSYRGLRLPSLREALEYTRSAKWKVNVEIKDAAGRACDSWIAEACVDLVRELGMVDSVSISSFNHSYLKRVRALERRLPLGALVDLEDPLFPPASEALALLRSLGAESWHPGMKGLQEEDVRRVREAGYGVNVWTVNEESDLRRMIDWGVTGVFTDFPDRLGPRAGGS